MAKVAVPDQTREWMEIALAHGWRVERTRKSHFTFYPPDRKLGLITVESTPSDHRSLKNTRARLRRAGLPV